jgi:hypothetical protein
VALEALLTLTSLKKSSQSYYVHHLRLLQLMGLMHADTSGKRSHQTGTSTGQPQPLPPAAATKQPTLLTAVLTGHVSRRMQPTTLSLLNRCYRLRHAASKKLPLGQRLEIMPAFAGRNSR